MESQNLCSRIVFVITSAQDTGKLIKLPYMITVNVYASAVTTDSDYMDIDIFFDVY